MQYDKYKQIINTLNYLPLTSLCTSKIYAEAGYKNYDKHNSIIKIGMCTEQKAGNENIVGSADAETFPIIASLNLYNKNISDLFLTWANAYNNKQNTQWAATIGYKRTYEKYKYPIQKLKTQHIYAIIQAQTSKQLKNLQFVLNTRAINFISVKDYIKMPFAKMQKHFVEYINHNHNFNKASKTLIQTSIRTNINLSNTAYNIFLQISLAKMFTSEKTNANNITLTTGINL